MPRPPAAVRRRLSRVRAHVRNFAAESAQDRLLGLAAEVAFFAVLSLFPALLIAVGLLGVLDVVVGADVAAGAQRQVVTALDAVLTDRGAAAVASVENLFEQRRGGLLTVATAGALVTLSGAFAVVVDALNLAYDTVERRSWIRRRLLGLLMGVATVVAAVLALAALVVGPFLGGGARIASLVGLGSAFSAAWDALRLPAVLLGLVLWAAALFHFAPNRRRPWRASLPGAVLTAVLWIAASAGLRLYLTVAAGANPVLGAFGGGVIVMTWLYLLSLALLLGGEWNATLERAAGASRDVGTDPPVSAASTGEPPPRARPS